MTTNLPNPSIARLAGLLYLVLIISGTFAQLGVRDGLIVADDAAATVANIEADLTLFRVGILSDFVAQTTYFLLAMALYVLLKPVNHNMALLFLLMVCVSVAIMVLNMLNQFAVVLLLSDGYVTGFDTDQLNLLVVFFLDLHKYGYQFAGIFFGAWLFPLGYVIYHAGYFPKLLGVLLMLAPFGYVIDLVAMVMDINLNVLAYPALLVTLVAEFGLCGWLLVRGVNGDRMAAAIAQHHTRVVANPGVVAARS